MANGINFDWTMPASSDAGGAMGPTEFGAVNVGAGSGSSSVQSIPTFVWGVGALLVAGLLFIFFHNRG